MLGLFGVLMGYELMSRLGVGFEQQDGLRGLFYVGWFEVV